MRQWAGIVVGVLGVALIVAPKAQAAAGIPWLALLAVLAGTLGLTLGTIWQKRSRPQMDLRVNAAIQFVGAFALTAPVAALLEPGRFDMGGAILGALAWAVLGLSVGGISILLVLLRRGAASRVAPLLYLSPAVAALLSWLLFGEAIGGLQFAGMILAVAGCFAARQP